MACFLQAANNVIQIKFVLFSNLACMTTCDMQPEVIYIWFLEFWCTHSRDSPPLIILLLLYGTTH